MCFAHPLRAALATGLVGLSLFATTAHANLLRNPRFQDDWLTLLPENQNHHWCYGTGFQNRRDYNPDGWRITGSWLWLDEDARPGSRRLVLRGPQVEARQRVPWVFVHDDRKREGFPDAGGFPSPTAQASDRPLSLVRDLTFRVRLRGSDVAPGGGTIELSLSPPGRIVADDALGSVVRPTTSSSTPIPGGTYAERWIEVRLTAAQWRQAVSTQPNGVIPLPAVVTVTIRYSAPAGELEIVETELEAAPSSAPNLLPNGSFESADKGGWPEGWSRPSKYRYFPPALYYLFNTWHNTRFENRGHVARDLLIPHRGAASLRMVIPAGDEVQVVTAPIRLNQAKARLIEVSAWIKTDQVNMLQIDALDDQDQRLDGFNFINKSPVSIGTDEWREIRQVFRPRQPLKSLRLVLAARGVNGYTLDDTGESPQANASGTIWWDDIRVLEPESTAAELDERRVTAVPVDVRASATPHLSALDPGERLFGANILRARVRNPGAPRPLSLQLHLTSPAGVSTVFRSPARTVPRGETDLEIPYDIAPGRRDAYTESETRLVLVDGAGRTLASSETRFAAWTDPLDVEIGASYLRPEQSQFLRLNLGFSAATMREVKTVRVDLVRRRTGEVLRTSSLPADPAAIAAQRQRLPQHLREDLRNLLLARIEVGDLPLQPFHEPERRYLLRVSVMDARGRSLWSGDSAPFCRLEHRTPPPPIASVSIRNGGVTVNDEPFIPWGAVYGHVPVYNGSEDAQGTRFLDLRNLRPWGIYDGYTAANYKGNTADFNALRKAPGPAFDLDRLNREWREERKYTATAFLTKTPIYEVPEGMASELAATRQAPMIVSVSPGLDEAFALFLPLTEDKLAGLRKVVERMRSESGKPVMVGHGGYWNRFEFEKVPFFDIYDPETEPLHPANLHTDLAPILTGADKAVWLRPQMYEDVPFERWRYHAYVEVMRGARGFQVAHGPGDTSLFRGLGAELERLKPFLWSEDRGPKIHVDPEIEHWSRRVGDRVTLIAATTRGLKSGSWQDAEAGDGSRRRIRITESGAEWRNESNSYGVGSTTVAAGAAFHAIQNVPDARVFPAGSRLRQWVRLPREKPVEGFAIVVKADGRFTHAASWGRFDTSRYRSGGNLEWLVKMFYRNAAGFLGWGAINPELALPFVPARSADLGKLPAFDQWTHLDIPLDVIGASNRLIDGVAFLHESGVAEWGETSIVDASGREQVLWGNDLDRAPERLRSTRVEVEGLRAGARITVLFEDREIVAHDGYFVDDFRGADLYQRFGGGPGAGYGSEPVALRSYEFTIQRDRNMTANAHGR